MKVKPDHISQKDWDAVEVPDMGDLPGDAMFRSKATSAQGIADDVMRQMRGKQKAPIKVSTTMRLPADVLEYFKSGGKGWQTRISEVLSEYVAKHH